MTKRDEFSPSVRNILAARVAHICSKPNCRASTSGPQLDEEKSVNLGVAAHITAAAPNGPRYDVSLTAAERASGNNGIWLCQNCAKLIDSDLNRFTVQVLREWKAKAERQARSELEQPDRVSLNTAVREAEIDIKHKLSMRDSLQKSFLKPVEQRRLLRSQCPYDRFSVGKVIIRSIENDSYPELEVGASLGESKPTISNWFSAETWNFYHNGLEILLNAAQGILNADNEWKFIEYGASFDDQKFKLVHILTTGLIPYVNIRTYDLHGDEYYAEPHLYCTFRNKGTPYERFRYFASGGDDGFYLPLDYEKRLPENE